MGAGRLQAGGTPPVLGTRTETVLELAAEDGCATKERPFHIFCV